MVVALLVAAAADMRLVIVEEWECQVASQKPTLLASTDSLRERLRRTFGQFAGFVENAVTNLGVDYFLGRRRAAKPSTKALRSRLSKLARRGGRLRAIKNTGVDMRKL